MNKYCVLLKNEDLIDSTSKCNTVVRTITGSSNVANPGTPSHAFLGSVGGKMRRQEIISVEHSLWVLAKKIIYFSPCIIYIIR